METKSTVAKITLLALLGAALTIYTAHGAGPAIVKAAASPTTAQTEVTTTDFVFGVVGVGRGQAVRISAALIAGTAERSEPIEVEFMFKDPAGNVMTIERQTILPGRAGSLDSHGIIAINQVRTDLIAQVSIIGILAPETRNHIVPTVEVYDTATGKTQFVLNNPRAIIAIL